MALVRVYCGLASADESVRAGESAASVLTIAVVDDAGRLLGVHEISDDPTGYAQLAALLVERTSGFGEAAVAADSDDHVVTSLLTAAGRPLAVADDDSADDFAERFADDDSVEEMQAPPAARRAVGLARALQAGAVVALPVAAARELTSYKPMLAAHVALLGGRLAAATALRETLRELYPAALRAYPDPSHPLALAVLDALPEPGRLAGRGTDPDEVTAQVVDELSRAGAGAEAVIGEAVTALRVAISESPRRGGVNKALAPAAADTIRHAVAAVRACDAACGVLVGTLSARIGPPAAPPAPRRTRRAAEHAVPSAPPADPGTRTGRRSRPEPATTGPVPVSPTPLTTPPVAPEPLAPPPVAPRPSAPPPVAPAAAAGRDRGYPPVAEPPRRERSSVYGRPAAPPAGPPREPVAPAAASGMPAPPVSPAASPPGGPLPSSGAPLGPPPGAPPFPPPGAPSGSPQFPPPGNRPVSVPPPPPGMTPIVPGARPVPPAEAGQPFRPTLTDAAMNRARTERQRTVIPPRPARVASPGDVTDTTLPIPTSPPPAPPPAAPPAAEPGSRANWPLVPNHDDRAVQPPSGDPGDTGRVRPPWQDMPSEPPALRLVEPQPDPLDSEPPTLVGSLPEPPALRLVDGDTRTGSRFTVTALDRSAQPPVAEEGDGDLLIFAQARSAWFTGHDEVADNLDWSNPADTGWQAAERASQPQVAAETPAGLPKRVPQANLVPGSPLREERPLRIVRDAASIAAHTTGYFRGWRRGQEIGGYAIGGRPGRESAGGWDFSRDGQADAGYRSS